MSGLVRLEVEGGIGTIRLERPPMNALNVEIQDALHLAADEASGRRDISAVILYGGERVFAAGADIKEMQTMSYTDMVDRSAALQAAFTAVARIPKPTVAAVTGYALGGGLELALACDFRVAGNNARFGQPEVKLGILPGYGGSQRLPRLCGKGMAHELILGGEMISAEEALRIGLVNHLTEPAELLSTCEAVAKKIIANAPLAVQYAMEAVERGMDVSQEEGLFLEATLFGLCCATEDMREGTRAFLEKRPAQFKAK